MMRNDLARRWDWLACSAIALTLIGSSTQGGEVIAGSAPKQGTGEVRTRVTPIPVDGAPELLSGSVDGFVQPFNGGVTAGTPPGTPVYVNEQTGGLSIYRPGANQRMADDLTLANGACNFSYYSFAVGGLTSQGSGNFSVHAELWNGDPCLPGSLVIDGTQADFTPIPIDNTPYLLEAEITAGEIIPIPATVWLALTFSHNAAGWVIARQAEVGSTQNYWTENNIGLPQTGCLELVLGGTNPPWAGFWTTINCNLDSAPVGACCDGNSCTQTTEAACIAPAVWNGAFTTCEPNSCQQGTCCIGTNFGTCTDATETTCSGGIFHPNDTCAQPGCPSAFKVFENDFTTGIFDVIDTNTKWADDLTFGPGTPCNLGAFELLLAGSTDPDPPVLFDSRIEFWTNNDRGTPADVDDIPGAPIPGASFDAVGLTTDASTQRVLGGPFTGVTLPDKAWVVVTTTNPNAGPVLGGTADVGFSQDGFAIFNAPGGANAWTPNFWYGGFSPTNCPGGAGCVPAGSFRVNVWCEGDPPTGACCVDTAATCTESVTQPDCEGRWVEGETCENAFSELACGSAACCHPNFINPSVIECNDFTPAMCNDFGGASRPGAFCEQTEPCPGIECIGQSGDCFAAHGGPGGCEDAYCCQIVCTDDSFCCTTEWDGACAETANNLCERPLSNDSCSDAEAISGTGTFPFDNTLASTDGPAHAGCSFSGQAQINDDLWYCWTSPCTDTVFVRTCGQTAVDTKVAVYSGCSCLPTDGNLLACNDDLCPLQSMVTFAATQNQTYMIRLGNFPGEPSGSGTFSISCGAPDHIACPGGGDCCTATASTQVGCTNNTCCETVCACDPFCCESEWDEFCAGNGNGDSGCGAAALCGDICEACPDGPVTFVNPLDGTVDARRPHPSTNPGQREGISQLIVTAPAGSNQLSCWDVCETNDGGSPNGVASITDLGGGQFRLDLARPITTNAVTTVTYLGNNTTGEFISHPANVNGDSAAAPADILDLIDGINGTIALPWGIYSGDIDRSNVIAPADILEEIDLLNGAGDFDVWNGTPRPTNPGVCP